MSRTLEPQAALAELAAWADDHRAWPVTRTFEGILRATFARSTKTFNAGRVLTGDGYGPQAGMLTRALFEDVVVSYWMTYVQQESWVVERLKDRRRYGRLLMRDLALVVYDDVDPDEQIGADQLAALQGDRPRLEALFGRHGEAFWWANDVHFRPTRKGKPGRWVRGTHRTLDGLVRALEGAAAGHSSRRDHVLQPPQQDGRTTLRNYLALAHNFNNMMVHHTEFGVQMHASGDADGDPETWNEDPSEQWVKQIELTLYWNYGQMILLMCDRLRPDLSDAAAHAFEVSLRAAWADLANPA